MAYKRFQSFDQHSVFFLWELYRVTFQFLTVKTALLLSKTSPPHSPATDVSNNLQQSLPHPPPQRLGLSVKTLIASEDF